MYGRARMRYVSRQVLFREPAWQLLLKEFDDGPNFCPMYKYKSEYWYEITLN